MKEDQQPCPFNDFCEAASSSCSKKDLKDYCRPLFKSQLMDRALFIEGRILQIGGFSWQEINDILLRRPLHMLEASAL